MLDLGGKAQEQGSLQVEHLEGVEAEDEYDTAMGIKLGRYVVLQTSIAITVLQGSHY